jgi:hypothetical protein
MISHKDGTRGILLYELIACPILIELDGTLSNGNLLELACAKILKVRIYSTGQKPFMSRVW